MRYSGIGGQAVIEGVMMRNGGQYAVAVRKPDHEIEVNVKSYRGIGGHSVWTKAPLVRGVLSFIDSLVLGMSSLMFSASFYEDEEEQGKREPSKKDEAREKALMTGVVTFSIIAAVAIFMVLPYFLSTLFQKITDSDTLIAVMEGVLRLVIFIGYLLLISRMRDIQRVFMYHGAEHKCINCIEHGLELNISNVRKSSKEHKRCGTSFLMFVVIISIILFLFIRVDSHTMRLIIRLLLVPVIAGVSYEVLRLAGRYDNRFINLLSRPGMWVQGLTTKEPDDEMIEVGIASVEAVFDWREYQKKVREENGFDNTGGIS